MLIDKKYQSRILIIRIRMKIEASSIHRIHRSATSSIDRIHITLGNAAMMQSADRYSSCPAKFVLRGSSRCTLCKPRVLAWIAREKRWEYTSDSPLVMKPIVRKPYIRFGRSCSELGAQHPGARGTSVRRRVMPHRKARESKEPSRCSRRAYIGKRRTHTRARGYERETEELRGREEKRNEAG